MDLEDMGGINDLQILETIINSLKFTICQNGPKIIPIGTIDPTLLGTPIFLKLFLKDFYL